MVDMRVRRGREQQVTAMAAAARHWLDGRVPAKRVDTAAQFVGQTDAACIGEAGVRMLLAAPEQWTPETLGRAPGRLAARGYEGFAGE